MRLLSFILIVCLPSIGSMSDRRLKVKIGLTNLPKTLDVGDIWHYQHFLIVQSLTQTLLKVDGSGDIVGDLAKKWEISPDGKKYTFYLKDCHFSDGSHVGADDVVASFLSFMSEESKSVVRNYLVQHIDKTKGKQGFKVVSDKIIEVNIKKEYAPFLMVLTMPSFAILKNKRSYSVGSGPYVLKGEYDPASVILKKNNFYCGSVKNEIITLKNVGGRVVKALKEGEVDVVFGAGKEEAEIVSKSMERRFKVSRSRSLGFFHLYANTKKGHLQRREVRSFLKSLIVAFHREEESKGLMKFGEFLYHYFPRGVMLPRYYKESSVGQNREKVKDIDLNIVLSSSYFPEEYSLALSKYLKGRGVNVKLEVLDGNEVLSRKQSGDYDLISLGYMGNYPDPDGLLDPIYQSGQFKYVDAETEDLEEAIGKVRHLKDNVERLRSYSEIMKGFESKDYFIPGIQTEIPIIHNSSLEIPDSTYRYEGEIFNIIWK